MSFLDYFLCTMCHTVVKQNDIKADLDILSLDILSITEDTIDISLETRISLSSTLFQEKDCLYLFETSSKSQFNQDIITSENFLFQNK